MSLKYLLSAVALFLVLGFILIKSNRKEFDHAKQLVVLRMIGHEILLHGGDSSSRVLPVKQLGEDEYQIRFEHPFTFSADSLIRVIERADIAPHYIVNVISCSTQEVVYAYANLETDIVPCTGRNQQKDCYLVNLKFPPARFNMYLLFVLVLPCVGGWYYYGKKKAHPHPVDGIPIGQFIFNNEAQHLIMNDQKIALTSKESRILYIFATAPNQVIDRNQLQKEVWEDEGVIVGRSLDMFISKLRKKLEVDPAVKLVNVHGKGYKLEISPDYSPVNLL